jgi:bifunctional enzyme CysN/CysC
VHRQELSLNRPAREKLAGHQGRVVWLTGLSGSDKSTIASAAEKILHEQGDRTYILDGHNVRHGLSKDLGFNVADRVENIRRIAEVAKLMMDARMIVLTAFSSPFRAERDIAKRLFEEGRFLEIFVDTPLAVAEERDPKGLYKKARSGQLPNFTGIDSDYEAPVSADLIIQIEGQKVDDSAKELIEVITKNVQG